MSERTTAKTPQELLDELAGGVSGLTAVLDAMAEAVTIRDRDDRILYANRAALEQMGFSSMEEIQSRTLGSIFGDYIVTDERGGELTMKDIPSVRLLAGRQATPLTIRTVHRRTGRIAWSVLKASPLGAGDGTPRATVMIIEDVTTEKLAEQRERFLARATDTLMSSIDYEDTLRNVAWLAVPEIADWCAVDLIDHLGEPERVVVAHRDPEKLALAEELRAYEPTVPREQQAVLRVARTGVSEIYPDITDEMLGRGARDQEHLELLRSVGFRSAIVAPMKARGRTLGVITFVTSESLRRLGEDDVSFVEQIAARAAIAVDNARLATSRRETAVTLQRSLLPEAVPPIEGWDVATMYRAASASDEIEVGGDFYDFIETPEGWIVLLGDVTGRGVEAAAMTSLVRYGARFLARYERSPSAILTRLDQVLREQPSLSLCTALCLKLGPEQVVMSSAGHPMPLIVGDGGSLRELTGSGPLLGALAHSQWRDSAIQIGPDETLLLYTDGVTDARGATDRFGLLRLREVLRVSAGVAPQVLLSTLETALDNFQVAGLSDDMGAVALRPVAVGRLDEVPQAAGTAVRAR
jgi:PAS domain S-box-containing protein